MTPPRKADLNDCFAETRSSTTKGQRKMMKRLFAALLLIAGVAMAQSDSNQRRRPPTGKEWVEHLDKDGDGKVSKSEFKGPADLKFSTLDKNGDNYITEDEAPTGPPPRGGNQGGRND
jgi:hypothetical protein